MTSVRDLSARDDFRLGVLQVRPSRRVIEGPTGSANLEPVSMLVFMALTDARGQVVTRTQLFDEIWSGASVGDDSLNRSIGQVRKALQAAASDRFKLETVPRTGYSLSVEGAETVDTLPPAAADRRRALALGIGAAMVALGGAGLWFKGRDSGSGPGADLKERGHQLLRAGMPREGPQAVKLLEESVKLDRRDPEAWGLLALAYRARVENGAPAVVTAAMRDSERAAREALAIDPDEGNALTALAAMVPEYGNWQHNEAQLRAVLKRAPDNVPALNFLTLLLQGVGRSSASFELNERAMALDPLDATPVYRAALKGWIFGHNDRTDQVLSRGLEIWPQHPALWNARLMTFAYSGRARDGLAYIDNRPRPPGRNERSIALWKVTLEALASNDPAVRAAARTTLLANAAGSSGSSVHVTMALSALGFLDDAFTVAGNYYAQRGRFVATGKLGSREVQINDNGWKRTMMLFTPATRPMRLDPRFAGLTRAIGLDDYWKAVRTRPDAFLFR